MGHAGGSDTGRADRSDNALGSVIGWGRARTGRLLQAGPQERLTSEASVNVSQPAHFAADWALLVQQVRAVGRST